MYPIDMGRGQKVTTSAGRIRERDPAKVHNKELNGGNTTVESNPARGSGGSLSRDSIAAHALVTFGSPEKAQHWMKRPNPLFHGKTPAQVIEFDLVGVEAELVRIDHGVYM